MAIRRLLHHTTQPYMQKGIQRKDFAKLEQTHIEHFRSILSPKAVVDDPERLEMHNYCWRRLDQGNSSLLLCPSNTQEVSKILSYCNQNRLAVVPQGGNTGLVGGSVPVFDEIILNLQNMNKIEKVNEVTSIVTCESGVILEKLNEFLEPYGL